MSTKMQFRTCSGKPKETIFEVVQRLIARRKDGKGKISSCRIKQIEIKIDKEKKKKKGK